MTAILVLLAVSIAIAAYVFRKKLAARISQVVSQVRTNVSKPETVIHPPVYTDPSRVPEQSVEDWLATLPPSTRAYIPQGKEREYRDQLVARAQAAAPVDYSGFVLVNSSQPKVNEVGTDWVEFTVVATLPRQMIQASAQNAVWLDEEVNGALQSHRQASNPTALNLKLPPGEHKYRVKLDRPSRLVVQMREY